MGYYDTSKPRNYSYIGEVSKTNIDIGKTTVKKKQIRNINKVKTESKSEEPVRCPKCGSTQIQVLRKKWSPLTGVFTNKVERVCVNCKKRF